MGWGVVRQGKEVPLDGRAKRRNPPELWRIGKKKGANEGTRNRGLNLTSYGRKEKKAVKTRIFGGRGKNLGGKRTLSLGDQKKGNRKKKLTLKQEARGKRMQRQDIKEVEKRIGRWSISELVGRKRSDRRVEFQSGGGEFFAAISTRREKEHGTGKVGSMKRSRWT